MNRVIQGICVVLIVLSTWLTIGKLQLETRVAELETSLVVCNTNKVAIENALTSQNDKVESMRADSEAALKKYQELVEKPPEIRYEVVYKKVPTIGVKSDECEEIKKLVDDIRNAGY